MSIELNEYLCSVGMLKLISPCATVSPDGRSMAGANAEAGLLST